MKVITRILVIIKHYFGKIGCKMRAKYLQYLKMDTRKIFDQKRGEIGIIYHLLQLHGSFLSCSESGCNRL